MVSLQRFHERTGKLVKLSNDKRSAERLYATEEFNEGMLFSEKPLNKNEIFTVKIMQRIASWSGSIEIGLIGTDPASVDIPKGAIMMREGNWLISGTSIHVDGATISEEYCKDLDILNTGDDIGIMRNENDEIHLFINGQDQGIAAYCTRDVVWAVVDLYGKCASVTIVTDRTNRDTETLNTSQDDARSFSEVLFQSPTSDLNTVTFNNEWRQLESSFRVKENSLRFNSKCGSLIYLLNEGLTAFRRNHHDEFNNGVVMTNRTLENNEMFEIRINTLVDKWSGSIEMGVTTHAPDLLEIPTTMTNLRSGTVMLSGCGIITNGKGTRKEYLDFHLDKLKVGDHVGLLKTSRGTLHYYINGVDQGVAANHIPPNVYGVVDLYGMAVSVSIVPHYSIFERTRRNEALVTKMVREPGMFNELKPLLFSDKSGDRAEVLNGGRSARRRNPVEEFNHAVVTTNRVLKSGEIFSIQVDEVVNKWSGSLEIGVTTHSPQSLHFPATMTNIRTGTWMMTATGVMCNGAPIVEDYGSDLETLQVGNTLGVCRKSNGNLNFFINGIDQGLAASNVPENVYAVIDLYGQVSKASVIAVNKVGMYPVPSISPQIAKSQVTMKFNHECSKNITMTENQNCVFRKEAFYFYAGGVLLGEEPLKVGKLCEFRVDKIVKHWTGSLEIGVSGNRTLSTFPETLVNLKTKTWVWTGCTTVENGVIVGEEFPYDTEDLRDGSRIGILLSEDGTVHGYVDGVDVGVLFENVPSTVYPIINLYGKCSQITFLEDSLGLQNERSTFVRSPRNVIRVEGYTVVKNKHRFHHACDKNITLLNDHKVAIKNSECHLPILFSANPLRVGHLFEVQVKTVDSKFSGSFAVGLASVRNTTVKSLAVSCKDINDLKKSCKSSVIISSHDVLHNGITIKQYYCPKLKALSVGDKVGILICEDETIRISVNGSNLDNVAENFSHTESYHVVVSMGARVSSVEVLNSTGNLKELRGPPSISDDSSSDESVKDIDEISKIHLIQPQIYLLSRDVCGKNVRLTDDGLMATRVGSYNQAIVVTLQPLAVNKLFQIKVKSLDEKWKSSLSIGITAIPLSQLRLPVNCLKMSNLSWTIHDDSVYKNGRKIKHNYGTGLDSIHVGQRVGLLIDESRNVHMYIDGMDQGVAFRDAPSSCRGIVDLYGSCDEIEVIKEMDQPKSTFECEKVVMEDNLKETQISTSNMSKEISCCLNKSACLRFLDSLALPTVYFMDKISCYCSDCFKCRGESIYKLQGDPALQFAQPVGWCKFPLRIHPNVDVGMISKRWNVTYYGTKVGGVRKSLDLGEVPIENSPVWDLRTSLQEDEESQSKRKVPVILSPIIHYAADEKFSPKDQFFDSVLNEVYTVQVAFQLFIKPSTFKIRSPNFPNPDRDHGINSDAIEWAVKQPGTTILSHILVKLDKAE